jgi:putative FmdB family regulatory protein
MPLYDYKCRNCEKVTERIKLVDEKIEDCPICGGVAVRIISTSGVNCANDDTEWVRSVREVVEKGSGKPHCEAFLKNPTRSNYKKWMKGEGIRHKENGEGRRPEAQGPNITEIMNRKKARERIIVGRR